jgi:DHA1 family multidrug resistance protein-like MFS transporter
MASSSSLFDSQATTPTRVSFDQQSSTPHNGRLDTIPSAMYTDDGQDGGSNSPSISPEKADLEAGPGLKTEEASEKAPQTDPNLVVWSGPDDPENPQNFSVPFKWTITMLLSSLTVWITFSSSVFSQATLVTAELYGVSTEITTLATSLPLFVSFLFRGTVGQQKLTGFSRVSPSAH